MQVKTPPELRSWRPSHDPVQSRWKKGTDSNPEVKVQVRKFSVNRETDIGKQSGITESQVYNTSNPSTSEELSGGPPGFKPIQGSSGKATGLRMAMTAVDWL